MKRLCLAMLLMLAGCSGGPISDNELAVMKPIPFPTNQAKVVAAVQYLSASAPTEKPLQGIVFASFSHPNPGQGECDTPFCWMVQLINPEGTQTILHGNMPSASFEADIKPDSHLVYNLTDKALLGVEPGHESFICLDRHAVDIG